MTRYTLRHLSDSAVGHGLGKAETDERGSLAWLLAYIAEFDRRRLFLPAGYSSMYQYCIKVRGYSEDEACKRIRAARAARRYPAILAAIAAGRLHLSGVVALAPHLIPANAEELLCVAEGRTRAEIDQLLAERFPRADVPTLVVPVVRSTDLSAPGRMEMSTVTSATMFEQRLLDAETPSPTGAADVPRPAESSAPGRMIVPDRSRIAPLTPERFALQVTIDKATHDKLRHAQELLGHAVPSGDVAQVLDRALDALIAQLEKRKFAATDSPRPRRSGSSANPRHIPAQVKGAVWQRDGGQCTFVGENGHRCAERTRVEFDHVEPVAHGGGPSVSGIRLRCRAHNQLEAERIFGAEFMQHKRETGGMLARQ